VKDDCAPETDWLVELLVNKVVWAADDPVNEGAEDVSKKLADPLWDTLSDGDWLTEAAADDSVEEKADEAPDDGDWVSETISEELAGEDWLVDRLLVGNTELNEQVPVSVIVIAVVIYDVITD
jgi:hypothetical protein